MKKETKPPILLLAFYSSGIIIGGGILALPFTALDTGLLGCIFLLAIFALVFNYTYWRILGTITDAVPHTTGIESLYDVAIEYSSIGNIGKLAFDLGLTMYTIPADFVYILYGSKSMCELHELLPLDIILYSLCVFTLVILIGFFLSKNHFASLIKVYTTVVIWLIGIYFSYSFYIAVFFFSLSLLSLRYVPEIFSKRLRKQELVEVKVRGVEILPHHVSSAWFALAKVLLICGTPFIGLILILLYSGNLVSPLLLPRNLFSFIAPLGVIVFMYVGTGIYNILIYDWIRKRLDYQKKISLLAILISFIAYLTFTLSIVLAIEPAILIKTNAEREHALMAMSEKLRTLGLTFASYLVILIADFFAMLSVSIAFLGFTDTLSHRFGTRFKVNENCSWIFLLIVSAILVSLSEVFNITNAATDALSFAGAAGGGLFILVLPWLLKTDHYKRRLSIALIMFLMCLSFNIIATVSSLTFAGKISGIISTAIFVGISIPLFKKSLE